MNKSTTHMYANAKSWNPFKGCGFDCAYCGPSFKRQAKRQKQLCEKCYTFEPHEHPERLARIPAAEIVFACGNGDISFADPAYVRRIIEAMRGKGGGKTFYLQTKRPESLKQFLGLLPDTVILVATLETNRDDGYDKVSKAPPPSVRFWQFLGLDWPRKVVTAEPLMDFDVGPFADWIIRINPEYVWLGMNSRPAEVRLPEPTPEKLRGFTDILLGHGIPVRGKDLRGIALPGVERLQD
jgi:hypothetical protein